MHTNIMSGLWKAGILLLIASQCYAQDGNNNMTTTTDANSQDNSTGNYPPKVPVGFNEEGRIYNGYDAQLGWFPFQVRLHTPIPGKDGIIVVCGGTLVSQRHVITAAHCVYNFPKTRVYMGLVDVNKEGDAQQIESSRIIQHPDYDPNSKINSFANDIAIIILSSDAQFSSIVQPAYLPYRSLSARNRFDNLMVYISGWGETGDDGGYKEDHSVSYPLKYNYVKIWPYDECAKSGAPVDNICTERKTVNSGPCSGDSGGPLTYRFSDGRSMLLGVTSYLVGKCKDSFQAGFCNVARYLDWIQANTGLQILD